MHFGKRLRRLLRPQWQQYYIDYKKLKQTLKQVKGHHDAEHLFLLALDGELGKVNAFFAAHTAQMTDSLDASVRSLHGGCKSEEERFVGIQLLLALRDEFIELRKYTELNYVAVLKIVKKCNKFLELSPIIASHLILLRQPFYISTAVSQAMTRIDVLVSQLQGAGESLEHVRKEDFTCAICLDILHEPVVLSCSHRFCADCIHRHLKVASEMDAATASNSRSSSRSSTGNQRGNKPMLNTTQVRDLQRHAQPAHSCPICRRVVDSTHVASDTILERFIVRCFGEKALEAEKKDSDPAPLEHPAPPIINTTSTPKLTHVGAYSLGDLLGRGRFARVFIGQRSLSSQPHAVKVFEAALKTMPPASPAVPTKIVEPLNAVTRSREHRQAAESERTARTEIATLSAVARNRCPFLPKLIDIVWCNDNDEQITSKMMNEDELDEEEEDDSSASSDVEDEEEYKPPPDVRCLAVVLPLYSGGDLAGYVDSSRGLSERMASYVMIQLIEATRVLHLSNYVHRDIKADNILIRSLNAPGLPKGTPHVVLCDMGLAVTIGTRNLSPAGTLEYIPPEALTNRYTADPAFDVYALGVLLFAMVAHRFPFNSAEAIRAGSYALSRRFSPSLGALITKMIDRNPSTRITLTDILADPWMTQAVSVWQNSSHSSLSSSSSSSAVPMQP